MENQHSNNKQPISWSASDQESLVKTIFIILKGQKRFGEERTPEDIFNYYKFKMEKRFTVERVISAIEKYTDKKTDIPTAADLIAIIEPEDDKITHEEYKHALRQWELEGKLPHSHWKAMALAYEDQQAGLDYADRYRIKNQEHAARIANMGQTALIEKSEEK